ncbi:hypothetical protein ACJ2_25380 [Pantoea sp. QMID2]|nr:hypothetical protein ACJ3_28970 [Pantoea sp. QMID3]GME42173.1 hypothetical protein ACJ1_29750 [Pantoea sp. QMID1]GME57392.1 hypothetical protein ACJ4_26250 [Pantoea sp. QMID4]GME58365.1 hypothetical protein ACJ2_25380 [Pantoea sp. QMID2]
MALRMNGLFLICNNTAARLYCQFMSTVAVAPYHCGERSMIGKSGLAIGMVVWLAYVAWIVHYYSDTFMQFSR